MSADPIEELIFSVLHTAINIFQSLLGIPLNFERAECCSISKTLAHQRILNLRIISADYTPNKERK